MVYADIEKIKRECSVRPIFVGNDSSFWHGFNWSEEKKKIKVRKDFWYKKIEDNIRRDKVITLRLRQDDWKVFRFWDFEIKKDVSACVNKIARVLLQQK